MGDPTLMLISISVRSVQYTAGFKKMDEPAEKAASGWVDGTWRCRATRSRLQCSIQKLNHGLARSIPGCAVALHRCASAGAKLVSQRLRRFLRQRVAAAAIAHLQVDDVVFERAAFFGLSTTCRTIDFAQ